MSIYNVPEYRDSTTIGRGWSNALWGNCPWNLLRDQPGSGFTYFDDFIGSHTGTTTTGVGGGWTITAIAGTPTIAMDNAHGGTATATAAASTDTHGFIINPGSATAAFVTPGTGRKIWLEFLLKQTLQTSTLGSSFVGLATQAAGMTTTGALTATNYIGFHAQDLATAEFKYLNAGATVYDIGDALLTYVTTVWIKVGFYMEGLRYVVPYVNGRAKPLIQATSTYSLPDDIMNVTWSAVSGGGSGTPTMTVDWVRFACQHEPTDTVTL